MYIFKQPLIGGEVGAHQVSQTRHHHASFVLNHYCGMLRTEHSSTRSRRVCSAFGIKESSSVIIECSNSVIESANVVIDPSMLCRLMPFVKIDPNIFRILIDRAI